MYVGFQQEHDKKYIINHFDSDVFVYQVLSVYCTAEEGGRAWTDGADSGAVGVWDLVHYFLVARFKQENLLICQVGIHACQKSCKYKGI